MAIDLARSDADEPQSPPSILTRIARAVQAPENGRYSTDQIAVFLLIGALVSRIAFLLIAEIVRRILGMEGDFVDVMCKWDCGWYSRLAENGYADSPPARPGSGQVEWAFFPLYPMLVSFVSDITNLTYKAAGMWVSNSLFAITPSILFLAYHREIGVKTAAFASVLYMVSPLSIYSSLVYTESLFGLLLVLYFYGLYHRKWIFAGVCGALLSASRAVGVFAELFMIIVALQKIGWRQLLDDALCYLRFRPQTDEFGRLLLGIVLSPLGAFLYVFFLHQHVGDGFAFKNVQIGWNREWQGVVQTMVEASVRLQNGGLAYLYFSAWLGGFVTLFLLYKRRFAEALFLVLVMYFGLSTQMNSIHRYIFAVFPAILGLAMMVPDRFYLRAGVAGLFCMSWCIYLAAWLSKAPWMT